MARETDRATNSFVAHRDLLFAVASDVVGSPADAEDVLQEAWLRWVKVELEQVLDHRAFLVRITTRLSLDRLRALKRRKEAYVGPGLPEPLLTTPDVADEVELVERVATAIVMVLETLSPTERVVLVLREAFAFGYGEIAGALEKSPAAVRQIAHRARRHVGTRRRGEPVAPGVSQAVVESFRHAAGTGDVRGLLEVLAPGLVTLSDDGVLTRAPRRLPLGAASSRHSAGPVAPGKGASLMTNPTATVVTGSARSRRG